MSIEQLRTQVRYFLDATETGRPWRYRTPTPRQVGRFYDRYNHVIAQFYGGAMHYGYWTGPDDGSSVEVAAARLTDLLIDRLGVGPGDRVLDVGCGTGKPAVQLARATGAEVVGISVSAGDVTLATALARSEGLAGQVRFEHADALDLPFGTDSFDAALALESLIHIERREQALAQIARVLKPGGRLALTDFIQRGPVEEDGDAQWALAEVLAAWRSAPLVRAENYPGFAATAGLVIDELVDISEHTKYTVPASYSAMRDYAQRHNDLPPELARILSASQDSDWQVREGEEPSEGVIMVAAHRPA